MFGNLLYTRKSIFNQRICRTKLYYTFFQPHPPLPFGPTLTTPRGATAEMRCEIFNPVSPVTTPSNESLSFH